MLRVDGLVAGYLGAPVLHEVCFDLSPGEVFCLLGANGAGKSTIAKTTAGLIRARSGSVAMDDREVTTLRPHDRVRAGLSLVPESRDLFTQLTVLDNLILGAYTRPGKERRSRADRALEVFPQLRKLLKNKAGNLSGGEQQMLAIGRALMADPRYLILDEPSLGLAPLVVDLILKQVRTLASMDVGVLLIEQNVKKALAVSDRAAVVESGRVTLTGSAHEVANDPRVVSSYLGADE